MFGPRVALVGNRRSEEQPLGKLQEGRVEHSGDVGDINVGEMGLSLKLQDNYR